MKLGLVLAVVSAATFGSAGALAASLIDAGWSPDTAVTARLVVAAAVLTPFALVRMRGRWTVLRRGRGMLAAYGLVAVAGAQLCYFNAVSHVSVGVALLLEYLGIMLVVGWLWLRHGQRPRRRTVAGALASVVGLVLVLNLGGSHRVDLIGLLWGLGAAVGLAVYFVLSSREDEPLPPLVLAWAGLSIGAITLVLLAVTGLVPVRAPRVDVRLLEHRVSWLVPVLCLALVAAVLAYLAGISAARLLGAKVASFVGLTEVLFAVAFAWALLGQVPAPVQFAGGALILTGVALVRLDELHPPAGEPARPTARRQRV